MEYKSTPSTSHTSWQWNSPLPYLFGGLGIMVALITVALIVLACSYRTTRSNTLADAEEKPEKAENSRVDAMMPQIVVIMAGEENPSHLAVPLWSSPNYLPRG